MTPTVMPEVEDFVGLVRLYLGDLDDEVRDELTEGLAADLAELVDDRGVAALPDPESYADELRAAAGLPERRRHRLPRRRSPGGGPALEHRLTSLLDRWATRWAAWAGQGRRAAVWDFARSVRPAWWVARGWLAVELVWLVKNGVDAVALPFYDRHPLPALALLAGAVVISVQIGRGRWWPPSDRTPARVLLLGLNVTAVATVPAVLGHLPDPDQTRRELLDMQAYYSDGVYNDGKPVCNLQPYDAQGRPLEGVQLVDVLGNRLDVHCSWEGATLPWTMGDVRRYNVFPQYVRRTGTAPSPEKSTLEPVEAPRRASDSE